MIEWLLKLSTLPSILILLKVEPLPKISYIYYMDRVSSTCQKRRQPPNYKTHNKLKS